MTLALPPRSACCCSRPKQDSHGTEQAKLRHGGGEQQRCMETGLCKSRMLRAAGMMWTDQKELPNKGEGEGGTTKPTEDFIGQPAPQVAVPGGPGMRRGLSLCSVIKSEWCKRHVDP